MSQTGRKITVRVPVDHEGWMCDYETVLDELRSHKLDPKQDIIVFEIKEGVSLEEMGVLALIRQWQKISGFANRQIEIQCHNVVESTDYHNMGFGPIFFNQGVEYSRLQPTNTNAKKFALFLGRPTLPRICMSWHMNHYHSRDTLVSWMTNNAKPDFKVLDQPVWPHNLVPYQRDLSAWWQMYDQKAVKIWYWEQRPGSIDGHHWNDQYTQGQSVTNRSLVEHYDKFCVEIVAETMNYGNTFWVTEKTVRPIVTGKPFMIFGARNFLARLRMLGFRTFHDLWDESYDLQEGLARWMIMRDVIADLAKLPRVAWRELMLQAQEIALENYTHYHSLVPWHMDDPWPRDGQITLNKQ